MAPTPSLADIDAALVRGDYDAALEQLAARYEEDPTSVEVASRVARALFHVRRYDEAEAMYAWLAAAQDCDVARTCAQACRERQSQG
ncbi:MAG: tetratricopeptide repeat protein [Deltaproteobacteria bacterium]|nr:tetratricopeptide repeat protein [Deltaproteobacteria bacterium]